VRFTTCPPARLSGQLGEETKTCPQGFCTTHERLSFMLCDDIGENDDELVEIAEMDVHRADFVEIAVSWSISACLCEAV